VVLLFKSKEGLENNFYLLRWCRELVSGFRGCSRVVHKL
jgi:hypothetical protein